jgi:hypothetical protein
MNLKDNGTWTSSDNTVFFKFDAEMDNGDNGSFLAKSNPPQQKVGEEYEYTIEEKNGHNNIKFAKAAGAPFQAKVQRNPEEEAKRQLMIVRQSSLKAATDLVCNDKIQFDVILLMAEIFTDYATGQLKAANMKDVKGNDLPF